MRPGRVPVHPGRAGARGRRPVRGEELGGAVGAGAPADPHGGRGADGGGDRPGRGVQRGRVPRRDAGRRVTAALVRRRPVHPALPPPGPRVEHERADPRCGERGGPLHGGRQPCQRGAHRLPDRRRIGRGAAARRRAARRSAAGRYAAGRRAGRRRAGRPARRGRAGSRPGGRAEGRPGSPLRRGPVQPGRHETPHRAPGEGRAPRRGDGRSARRLRGRTGL